MESKAKQNPNYEASAVNLCNPKEVAYLLTLYHQQEKALQVLTEEIEKSIPQQLRDTRDAVSKFHAQTEANIRTAIDEFGSYQDTAQGIYAVKQLRRTITYLADKVRSIIPQYAEAVIDGVNKAKVAGLLKGGLITQLDIDQFSSTKEDFAYILKYPPTGKEEGK